MRTRYEICILDGPARSVADNQTPGRPRWSRSQTEVPHGLSKTSVSLGLITCHLLRGLFNFSISDARSQTSKRIEWAAYGNEPGGMRYR